ncbi:unnamed protein product [Pocillopora meandrina]|uniref:Protein kinase domain-containing protein n=1 Tax=Pocillopora meandrina TaxID=46732 RepID=A0AAU9XZJ4_9CNID|nr:unnamed protein product [Pocillopora meandrina]
MVALTKKFINKFQYKKKLKDLLSSVNAPSNHTSFPMLKILNALSYVQQQGYVHCELKLDNLTFCFVTLTTDNKVKLFDVRVIKQEKEIWGALCGSHLDMAPEVLAGEIFDKMVDTCCF